MADTSLHPDIQLLNAAAEFDRIVKACSEEPPEALSATQVRELVSAGLGLVGRLCKPEVLERLAAPDADQALEPPPPEMHDVLADGRSGPVEEFDFLLGHSSALRSILTAQSALIALIALPPDHHCRTARATEGQDAIRKGLATLDRLFTEFQAEQESPVPLASWTDQLEAVDRGMMGNALRGLMHYRAQLGEDSGVGVICKAILYACAEDRVSMGGTVPPAADAFRLFLDDLHKLAGNGLAVDAEALGRAVMRTLAAIIGMNQGDRLASWFQDLARVAARNSGQPQA